MATFFGEVVLDSSRAVDDEDDDDDNKEEIDARVRWSPYIRAELLKLPDNKLPCKIMIVSVGAAAAGFAQAYILHEDFEIIGALFSGMKDRDVNSLTQLSPTDKSCYVYRSRSVPQVMVCLCNTEVEPEQSYPWVTQLFSSINTSSSEFYLSILSTYSTSEYKSEVPISDLETPFLRSLKTTSFSGTPVCPYLEQPNLISGLPAQLLTYSQISNIKAVLYVCYTDSIFLDSATMKIFQPLLKSTPIRYIVKENPHSDEVINQIVQLHSSKHSLYI